MSYHEGSNWQANKEDEKKPLYDEEAAFIKKAGEELRGKCGLPQDQRTFTLQDMLDCWKAAMDFQDATDNGRNGWDIKQYFNQKFNIDINQ